LGVFLGARRFGSRTQKTKRCIVLDRERYRYQRYISDISGQDIHAYGGDVSILIEVLAGWLRDQGRDPRIPGGRRIAIEFEVFRNQIPAICAGRGLDPGEVTFADYADLAAAFAAAIA